jgi:hypothetical protein
MLNGAARTAAFVRADDRFVVPSTRLHEHLLRRHGRTDREIDGLPLAGLHRFEQVEHSTGLNHLSHRHAAETRTHARISADVAVMIPLKLS